MNPRTAKAVWDHWSEGRSTMEIAEQMKGREEPEIYSILNDLLLLRIHGKNMPWDEPKRSGKTVVELPKGIPA